MWPRVTTTMIFASVCRKYCECVKYPDSKVCMCTSLVEIETTINVLKRAKNAELHLCDFSQETFANHVLADACHSQQ